MKTIKSKKIGGSKLGGLRRKALDISANSLVNTAQLNHDGLLPLLVTPTVSGVDLIEWVRTNRGLVQERLIGYGGILFRGFELASTQDFEHLVGALSEDLLHYTYRSTPRSEVEGKIYTSTEYPPDQHIPVHNEMSYSRSWPGKIWFYCVKAAASGGETPIADSRRVYQAISQAVRDEFSRRGVMYVRNYGGGLDLPWQNVFGTEDRSEVEAFCDAKGIEYEWLGEDRLRTRQICQGLLRHPETGDWLWFNQAHLFHVSSLPEKLRQGLLADLEESELPRHAFFGDGTTIPDAFLDEIRAAYRDVEVVFPWQSGDIVLLDNMLTAHGRRPFGGERKVLVGMAESCSGSSV